MTLNMKNYKGYNKLPYCSAHYPTTKFTVVTDTPESKRLAKTQNNISNLKYHAKYEKEKGHYTAVTDDPESQRLKKNTEQISQVAYTGGVSETRRVRNLSDASVPVIAPSSGYQPPPPQPAAAAAPPPPKASGARYKALYDYTAADSDEVSFVEGDFITEAEVIDDGWMTGTVERTGAHGMLPSNYVETP